MAVDLTTNLSILIQALSFVSLGGLTIPVAPRDEILKDLIKIEMGVQAVELGFYVTLLKGLSKTDLDGMARTRYYDWMLTTPTMLFTTINYLAYEKFSNETLSLQTVWQRHRQVITAILMFNLLMLAVGYLGETGRIPMKNSLILGFTFLLVSFGLMYEFFVKDSTEEARQIFNAMFSLWAIYGVAAGLSKENKNSAYNILDLLAKNFFGIFLYLKVRSKVIQ
jgi:bacteriorhodopsin